MRRADMQKLFTTEYQVDPKTGKDKLVQRYTGSWYTLDKKTRRTCGWLCLAGWVLAVAAFITAGVLPTWAGLCNYVVPWYILCMLPLFYLLLGSVKLLRLKEQFTEIDKSESLGYIKTSGIGLAVLGAVWSITTIIFLLVSNKTMMFANELIFLGCAIVNTAVGGGAYAAGRKAGKGIRNSECGIRN